jgi:hypothetical protein
MHVLLFWYPLFQFIIKFYVGSLNDANEAHKIEEISLLFFVYNFEYYMLEPCRNTAVGAAGILLMSPCF